MAEQSQVNHHERVAHHEAAHIVLAFRLGAGVLEQGINLDAQTSVEGAYGNAAVKYYRPNAEAPLEEQKLDLIHSLSIIVAGAASDAKLTGRSLRDALRQQPGDERVAREFLAEMPSPLIDRSVGDRGQSEEDVVLETALEYAEKQLKDPIVWKMVQELARTTLDAGGRLAKPEIEKLISRFE